MPGGTPASPKIAAALAVAPAVLAQKTRGLYPATQAILEAMVEGALVDYDTAVRIEARKLAKVMVGQNAKNMIQAFFFDLQAIRSGKARPKGFPSWRPAKVGILGAGMMGAGIAHANASRGIACVLKDVSAEKAAAGIAAIRKVTAAQVKRGALDELGEAKLLALVTPTAEARALDGCELIVEAVFENRALKAEVTREAEPMLAPDGVFASNTSTLPISGLAAASARPERFVGLHFFSPVHKMKLVEIIRGKTTSDETVARAYDYVIALGKTPIVVNDSRGFFTSRVFGTYVMEGAAMLAEGIAAPLIEHAALAAGMPVGPLAVLDETSLALSVHVLEQTRADWQAEGRSYVPSAGEALVEKMVKELGRPGRAGGGGFYDYPAGAAEAALAGTRDALREGRRRRRHRRAQAAPALPPVDRDGALPRRRRADEHGRSQHRLDLRHRLPGLDRRRDPVRRLGRQGALPRQRRRPRQAPRRSLRDLRSNAQRRASPARQLLKGLRRSPPLPHGGRGAKRGGSNPESEAVK